MRAISICPFVYQLVGLFYEPQPPAIRGRQYGMTHAFALDFLSYWPSERELQILKGLGL